ncbi:MAG: hypothetical protein GX808_09770 [Syntrophomonadaceae bacterium]|jgi:hypothetical protein|nr:hypothetical protein [Syntrophomonadaceae bacterium]
MKIEKIDLHGISVEEALKKVEANIKWCIENNVDVIDINHGKGHHSSQNFSVIKKEVRHRLKNDRSLQEADYKVVFGESELPVALTYDQGHTLVVAKGKVNNYIGGAKEQQKNHIIYSKEGKRIRKEQKARNADKRKRK